jgi:uncharacterized protein YbgA (DUF1722 family)/uncharacterized protein YbbK (DUF523 family)
VNPATDDTKPGTWQAWHADDVPIRIGVSGCLLGEEVRFDGGHKRDRFVTDVLSEWVEHVSVCPEVELGMGIPRPSIRLVDDEQGGVRLEAPKTGADFTAPMRSFAARRVAELRALDLDGFVLKKGSPSCGIERITVYRTNGHSLHRQGTGLFAEALSEAWPHLPLEEDGRLNDPLLRENFIERVFCRNRWRTLVRRGLSRGRLVEFHTAHKMLLRSHDEAGYQRLGQLVGRAGATSDAELYAAYEEELARTMRTPATVKRHVNVLQHALGYLKELLDASEKREVLAAIEDYRQHLVPLVVPLTLLRYGIRTHDVEYLAGQLYFDPHPKELMLRNHC